MLRDSEGAVAEEGVRKGYWKNAPTCETCGMPMSATHPGRKKLAQERAERERNEKEAEAKKETERDVLLF